MIKSFTTQSCTMKETRGVMFKEQVTKSQGWENFSLVMIRAGKRSFCDKQKRSRHKNRHILAREGWNEVTKQSMCEQT